MLSKFFIDRPVFACVLSILLVLLGGIAYVALPVAQYPELAPPVVRVEASYPGASAEVVAETVAAPLEQEINGVDRMIYMQSTSREGGYYLDVFFELGADVDMASVLVQNRVSIAEPKLPEESRRQGVTVRKQSTTMVGVIALHSPTGAYDDLFLANYMSINIKDEMARIYGVGASNIFPAKDYGMRVWIDPDKLKSRDLTVSEVNDAIRAQNVQVAAGSVGRPPAPAGQVFEYSLTTKGRLAEPSEFGDIIIKVTPDAQIVRLKDVARIELGTKDYSTRSTFNGTASAILVLYQLPGANLVDVARQVERKMEELRPALPAGVEAEFFYDSSMFIKASLEEVNATLLEAFVLVFIVVLVFLQNWRTTLIPMITIPVSLVGTFLFMALFGFSVNMLTMLGLVLAIGIVVDDAIVVVENVERVMVEGRLAPRPATVKAMSEIFGAIVAITLVLMSVFIPASALPGITGEMYRQFALTIAASTFLSAVNAVTLSPALCALLLKEHTHERRTPALLRPVKWATGLFNSSFDALSRAYAGFARFSARAWLLTLPAFAGVLFLCYAAFVRTPTGFVPNEDLGFVVVNAQLPDGASQERADHVVAKLNEAIRAVEGVRKVVGLSGFSVLDGNGSNLATTWIVLDPWDQRAKTGRSIERIIGDIYARTADIQEARLLVFGLPAINGLGNTSGFDMRVLDQSAAGPDALQGAVDELIGAANAQSKLAAVYSGFRAGVPQIYVDIDREKAIKLDIPLSSVFETLQTQLGSAYINDFNLFGRTYQVNVQAEPGFRLQPKDVLKLEVRNRSGSMIPLSTFTSVRDRIGPDRVTRFNLYRSATINGSPAPGASSGEAIGLMEQAARATLPQGMGIAWASMSFQEKKAGTTAVFAFGLGLLLVYLILAAQYESWTAPLSVALSIPLAILGAMGFLLWRGMDNNIFTQIGLVLLIGLGAKNAILIVEFARQNRMGGASIVESAVAAARTRLRPILMTSFAFILGCVPLLLATGAGAAGRRAIGTAVVGGMLGATLLGLVFTPTLYVVVTAIAERVSGRRAAPHASHGSPTA